MKRTAQAVWSGGLKDGKGVLTTPSGVLQNTPYSFHTRFEDGHGTNPEELIAAAHAGCFTMALSAIIEGMALVPEKISTQATLTMERIAEAWTITAIHLHVKARVADDDRENFLEAARKAETGCPVSRVLKAAISMDVEMEEAVVL